MIKDTKFPEPIFSKFSSHFDNIVENILTYSLRMFKGVFYRLC